MSAPGDEDAPAVQLGSGFGLDEAASLMRRTWPRPAWHYTSPLLARYLQRPSSDSALALGWRSGGELRAFLAAMPTPVVFGGGELDAVFTSFMTADAEASMHGASHRLLRAVLLRAAAKGSRLLLTMMAAGAPLTRAICRIHERQGYRLTELASFAHWIAVPAVLRRSLTATPPLPGTIREYASGDRAACAALLRRHATGLELAAVPAAMDLDALFAGGGRVWEVDGDLRGVLLAREREVMHDRLQRHVQLELVATGPGVGREEVVAFAGAALASRLDPEPDLLLAIACGSPPPELLRRLGFLPSPNATTLYGAWLEDGGGVVSPLAPLRTCWLEVY